MIIPLDDVKAVLGVTGTSEDDAITQLISHAAAFIEGEIKRRFDDKIPRTEYRRGHGYQSLYLDGHIDIADEDASTADIAVYERYIGDVDWSLVDPTDYERRGDELFMVADVWKRDYDYKLVYEDGYDEGNAPADIQALAMELVIGEYNANASQVDDAAGLTSETLVGVYSYTVESSAIGNASSIGGGGLSTTGQRTIERYRRRLV